MQREWYNIAKFMEKIESDRKENNNTIESKTSVFTNALDEELEKWKKIYVRYKKSGLTTLRSLLHHQSRALFFYRLAGDQTRLFAGAQPSCSGTAATFVRFVCGLPSSPVISALFFYRLAGDQTDYQIDYASQIDNHFTEGTSVRLDCFYRLNNQNA